MTRAQGCGEGERLRAGGWCRTVGIVHELIGNGDEAEAFFLWGKRIYCSQSLPIFMVAFSSALGILYRKKQLWDVAEKEFHGAREHLQAASTNISCKKCRLLLEVTVDQNLADLSQSIIESSLGRSSAGRSFDAESLYKSALNKLNDLVGWEHFVIRCKEGSTGRLVPGKGVVKDVKQGYSNAPAHSEENQWDSKKPSRERLRGERVGRKCAETRNAPVSLSKNQDSMHGYNLRPSRSEYQTSQNQSISGEIEVSRKHLSGRGESDCSGTSSQSDLLLEIKSYRVASSGEDWEFARRRLSLKLLAGLGNCLESRGQIHEAHEIIFQSISIFVRPDYFHLTPSTVSFTLMLDIIGKETVGDMFSIERAEILYNICRLCLTSYHSRDARIICCYLSHMSLVKLVAWLMLAFVLCREVPVLFQKVSRLLAVIFSLSSPNKLFSFTSSCKSLSESHWASYFHQASVGTHFSYHSLIINGGRYKVQHLADAKGGCPSGSSSVGTEDTWNLPRLAPESVQDLEDFVETFFVGLPCATAEHRRFMVGTLEMCPSWRTLGLQSPGLGS
ncbi:Peptidase C50, separase [Trema orientale]|uniref:Peptidase C50, separase n=1 Tax=Trema orientale TaxID=63057 RepID=A0A2P5AF71_TREOI|nr:Peptidase C50, separase [Trema orientale]